VSHWAMATATENAATTSNRATTTSIRGQQPSQGSRSKGIRSSGAGGGGDGPRIRIQLKNVYSAIAAAE